MSSSFIILAMSGSPNTSWEMHVCEILSGTTKTWTREDGLSMEGCRINSGVDGTSSIFFKSRLFPLIHADSLVICTIIGLYSSFHALKLDCFLYNFCFCVKKMYLHEFDFVQCVFMWNYSGICNKCDFGYEYVCTKSCGYIWVKVHICRFLFLCVIDVFAFLGVCVRLYTLCACEIVYVHLVCLYVCFCTSVHQIICVCVFSFCLLPFACACLYAYMTIFYAKV